MKILKIAKKFVIVIVVCFALFGAYKLFKPAPVIDVPQEDLQYLKDIGINVAEGGKASENGTSPLFSNVEDILPLDSNGNVLFQNPPATLNQNNQTENGTAPPFGTDNNNYSNSEAPPFDTTPENTTTTKLDNTTTPIFGQENINQTPPNIPSTNQTSPISSILPNPPLTATLTRQVESKVIAPSSPYASQHNAPPLAVPPSVVPTNQTTTNSPFSPISTIQPEQQNTPTNNQQNQTQPQTNILQNNTTEILHSTFSNTNMTTPLTHTNPTSPSVNPPLPTGNQTLTPPTPTITPAPPPPPSPTFLSTFDQQTPPIDQPISNMPTAFVNTGLRDENKPITTTTENPTITPTIPNSEITTFPEITAPPETKNIDNSYISPLTNLPSQTSPNSEPIVTNDPNYYSSAVPITNIPAIRQTIPPPQQTNNSATTEMAILNTPTQPTQQTQIDVADTLSSPHLQKNENQIENAPIIKPLPLVIDPEPQNKPSPPNTNNRYVPLQNNNSQNKQNTNTTNNENNESNLWDYLKATKPNNEAVLAPSEDAVANAAARVAFATNNANLNNSFAPSYGTNSADIFPNNTPAIIANHNTNNSNSDDNTTLANPIVAENSSAKVSNHVDGVVAASSSVMLENAIVGMNDELAITKLNNENNNNTQNKKKESDNEQKFDSTVVGDSTITSTIPFVPPAISPHPVLVTKDLTSESILPNNKPQPQPQPQQVRESVANFVIEQVRDYNTKENTKMHIAFVNLSKLYDQSDLTDVERDYIAPVLDRVALELIYSAKYHVLEPVYRVKPNDTIESIAQQFSLSAALLSKINGLERGDSLLVGSELKVVHGQFDAKIHTKRGELTLLLGGVYAGRFPVVIGRNVMSIRGEFIVQNKSITKTTKILTLNNGVTLNGLGRQISQNSLGVSQENIEELFDILTENSVIVME
ncbi:MAG: LysM peptidoglycan-binding domain-containing protein [Planctomycetaceae bacterium]|nr:LysM peptidoglycan-binding domain-containing protein [Planctomycetaceae bacterium]